MTVAGMLAEAGPVITEGLTQVWGIVTANPLLTFTIGCSILGVGFRFFRKAKRAAH